METKPKTKKQDKGARTPRNQSPKSKKYHSRKLPGKTAFDLLHELAEELERRERSERIQKLYNDISEVFKKHGY